MSSKLELYINELNKKHGEIATIGVPVKDIPRIPFSSPRMNYMLYGGIPMCRFIEFAGPEGSGKTTTALDVISNYQKMPDAKKVLYVDHECTFDAEWAEKLGVVVDELIIITPQSESAEDIFDIISKLVSTDEIGLVILDSLASMVPKQIKGEEMEKQQMGGISKSLTRFVNDFTPSLHKYNCTFIGINQVRDDMNNPYNQYTTPGGKAWKHGCSVRIIFGVGDYIDINHTTLKRSAENPYGHIVNASLKKSKVCKPDRKNGFYSLSYQNGIEALYDTIDCAILLHMINANGAWFKLVNLETGEIRDDIKFQGKPAVIQYYKEHLDEYKMLWEYVNKHLVEAI